MQFVLQVLQRRTIPTGTHPETQRKQTPKDAHLPILREELHAGNVPQQAHAEARGEDG